jgi:Sensors of blue-light using FAD
LRRLIYRSRSVDAVARDDLRGLLRGARVRNQASGISGLLLYGNGVFLHLIEGPAAEVEALYSAIGADDRHVDACVLRRDEAVERMFPGRPMAFAPMDAEEPAGTNLAPLADLAWMSDADLALSLFDRMAIALCEQADDEHTALESTGSPS